MRRGAQGAKEKGGSGLLAQNGAGRGPFKGKIGEVAEGSRKIRHPGAEDRLVFVAGDIFGDSGSGAFGVGHFSKNPTAG